MIYIKEKDSIKKYQVEIDKKKLENLKIKIIDECSKIEHIKRLECPLAFPNENDCLHVRNFTKKYVKSNENDFFHNPDLNDLYKIEYDFYHDPEIVKIIDRVLNNDEGSIFELLKYKPKTEETCLEDKLNEIIKNKSNDEKLIETLEETKDLLKQKKINAKQKKVNVFLPDVKSCVKLMLLDEISIDDYNRVYNFMDKEKQEKLDEIMNIKSCLQM